LGGLQGFTYSEALSINDAGQIVGALSDEIEVGGIVIHAQSGHDR
jgi:hypothetical protein